MPAADTVPARQHDRARVHAAGKALVVEDDDDYAALTTLLLQREGWEVERERNLPAALARLNATSYGVVLLNTALAAKDNGPALLDGLRAAALPPMIALSGHEDREELIERTVATADYDLVKPFSPRRFRAALRAVTRRGRIGARSDGLPAEVRVGDVTMSFGRLQVHVGNRQVDLSPREFALLHLLLANPGTVFTRDELARLAWGWRETSDSRAVDNTVRRLRRKMEPDPERPRYLITERGAGYRMAAP